MNAPLRLMLVDDHPLVRDGLRARLDAVPGLAVVAEADGADAALAALAGHTPDLVLMDIGLRGGVNGIELTRRLLDRSPALHVLMLTMHADAQYVRAARAAGARGYVLKDSPADEIVQAIRALAAGGEFFPADVPAAPADSALTPREREVLALIADGLSSREIGERLAMGVRTVETHRTNLRRKLALPSPAALVRYAVELRVRTQAQTRMGSTPRT